jgi:Uma2 family endonuclease
VWFQASKDSVISEPFAVPEWVRDRESFHRWAASDEFPEEGRIDYLGGEIWIDTSREQLFSHNQVKLAFTLALGGLVKSGGLGRFFQDGARLSHPEADLSAEPDAVFVSMAAQQTMRVRFTAAAGSGFLVIEGSPDMVLEVVSDSSEGKDTGRLRDLYWKAGIPEYWLVDARRAPLRFDILRHGTRGYSAARKRDGWVKSAVFGKEFRLTQGADPLGHPEYTLDVR